MNDTHMIIVVHWEIIVLQVPSEVNKIRIIDKLLERVQAFIKGDQNKSEEYPIIVDYLSIHKRTQ
jgi:hypothetical protein